MGNRNLCIKEIMANITYEPPEDVVDIIHRITTLHKKNQTYIKQLETALKELKIENDNLKDRE